MRVFVTGRYRDDWNAARRGCSSSTDGTVEPRYTAKDSTYHIHFRVTPQTGVGSYRSFRTNQWTGQACSGKGEPKC